MKSGGNVLKMDYEEFKKKIYKMTTIDLNYYKEKQMKRRIDSLISNNGIDGYENYIKALENNKIMYEKFINHLTINVSEFYRNPEQWKVLEQIIIPLLLEKKSSLRIWSAACSTGDEPYTIAMLISKFLPLDKVKIIATDIDDEVLRKAKIGMYTEKSVENLPDEFKNKYLVKNNQGYEISNELKKCIDFSKHNLLRDEYPKEMDLIVCRNVLIYFTEEAKDNIYINFNKALRPEGILFVGSTEQIINANKYHFKPTKTFFYMKEKEVDN